MIAHRHDVLDPEVHSHHLRQHATRLRLVITCLLALSLLAALLSPPRLESANYAIAWSVIDAGGGATSSSHYTLVSSLSPAEAPAIQSQQYKVQSGYIPGLLSLPQHEIHIWLPLVIRAP